MTLTIAACSGGSAPTSSPSATAPGIWAGVVANILKQDPSDFHSRVLADGKVSDQEYHEAEDLFTSCMADLGVVVAFPVDPSEGGYTMHPSAKHPSADADAANTQCSPSTIDGVQEIYQGQLTNPQGLDRPAAARQCLKEHSIADFADMSDAEFAQGLDQGTLKAATPQGALCLLDPLGQTGVTPDEAWATQLHPRVVTVGQ